jgi:hypothetical protein
VSVRVSTTCGAYAVTACLLLGQALVVLIANPVDTGRGERREEREERRKEIRERRKKRGERRERR